MIRSAALVICFATSALGQDATAQLQQARVTLEAAHSASDRIAALTQAVQAYEAGLSAMRETQRVIALQEADLDTALDAKRAQTGQLLAVLSTIGKTPQPAQQAHPAGPLGMLRAGMLVADLTPALTAQADELGILLGETQAIRTAQEAAQRTLTDGLQGAQTARAALAQAISNRTKAPARFIDDPVQTALFVASAKTLADFSNQIAQARPDQDLELTAEGDLPLPVTGYVLPDDGSGRAGVRIAAAPRALVTAPAPATILFQGALLDYGTVLILEPSPDTLFVMAGFADVFVQTGEVVATGAPLGLLGDAQSYDDGILTENQGIDTGNRAQTLYLEVRDGQAPVSPDAWFALE
jgi:septal ring factor EnvC (AmiA/AmiB activator)